MLKIYAKSEKEILGSKSSEAAVKFYEWAKRSNSAINSQFLDLSSHLTFCRTDGDLHTPPKIFLVGSQAGGRKAYGDYWADNCINGAKSPIRGLPSITAEGYLRAQHYGLNYDLIEFSDDKSRGLYERLIIPVYAPKTTMPVMLTTFTHFLHIEKKSLLPDGGY